MDTRIIHIVIGILFTVTGIVSLLDGVCNMRMSNLFMGVCFVVVGGLYFRRKREVRE